MARSWKVLTIQNRTPDLRANVGSIRKTVTKATANALLGELDAGRIFISIAKSLPTCAEKYERCICSVRRILAYTDGEMWTLHLEAEDIFEVSSESDRLRLELDTLEWRLPKSQ
jgi:hypothetical protein